MKIVPTAEKIAAATRHLLATEGPEAVSMRRVANAVGITPMAIYRHYPNRQALLDAVADNGFEELTAVLKRRRFSGDLATRFVKMADVYLDYALENPRLFELMFLAKRERARRFPQDFKAGHSPTASLMAALVKEGMESGHFRHDDPWEIVFEAGALLQGLIMLYLGGRIDMTPAGFRALYRRSTRRYFHGLRS